MAAALVGACGEAGQDKGAANGGLDAGGQSGNALDAGGDKPLDREGPPDSGGVLEDAKAPVDPEVDEDCVPTEELCNGKDDDCDGTVDEGFTAEIDGEIVPVKVGDACDGDDVDLCPEGTYVCRFDGFGVECRDNGAAKVELCNGKDDDCDGKIDEDVELQSGARGSVGEACQLPGTTDATCGGTYRCRSDGSGYAECGVTTAPTSEVCDGIDNDCDGDTDEDAGDLEGTCGECDDGHWECQEGGRVCVGGTSSVNWYRDEDDDKFPRQSNPVQSCAPPAGYISARSDSRWDCCDTDKEAKPGQGSAQTRATNCGGYDFNCDGSTTKVGQEDGVPANQCYRSACAGGFRRGWDGVACGTCDPGCGSWCAYVDGNPVACTASSTVDRQQKCL